MDVNKREAVDGVSKLEEALSRVRAAQKKFSAYTEEQVDSIFKAAATAANRARLPLAKLAVEETGMGVVEDKVIKNNYAAELSYERHKKLLETRAVSLDDVDNALSQRDSSRAALAAAQAELVAARDDLKHCTITAPIAGKIGSTVKTAGNYVTSGSLTLVTIVQLAPIRVKFSVSNREILDMSGTDGSFSSNDASVALTLANGTPYGDDGKIEYAENLADEQTDTMTVYALFANEDLKLVPGGTVAVTIAAERGVMRPAIPPTAVLQDTQGPYVWAVGDDGKVERRTVARGDQNGDWLFIEKGLKAGERVVADGAHRVRRGDTVKAAK